MSQVKDYNVLFIDNPVGTGFSNAEAISGFVKTNIQIAADLVECIRGFYTQLPKFKPVPTYITTESYGGKMGAEFALVWYRVRNLNMLIIKKLINKKIIYLKEYYKTFKI